MPEYLKLEFIRVCARYSLDHSVAAESLTISAVSSNYAGNWRYAHARGGRLDK
jgi:hypothetical protein